MARIIECVPNVSEGRRADVIGELAAAIDHVAGVSLLDRTSDESHNRSVFTIAGDARPLQAAILALFDAAIARIDMRAHEGVHPRLGAVDVVPFVPIAGVTLDECVTLARSVAAAVAERFALPVFLYEAAAYVPERRTLEAIRRGQFEALAEKLLLAEWQPDYGPAIPHPTAGATVIGARMPLIAYNINLASDRLDIAQSIARAIRESGGGLRAVKAMGVALAHRGVAQVSMNLTDYRVTGMTEVFDAVCLAAARHGADVLESELIGLVPEAALDEGRAAHIKLAGFSRTMTIEGRLEEITGQRSKVQGQR